jgi:hypothetical protein
VSLAAPITKAALVAPPPNTYVVSENTIRRQPRRVPFARRW